MNILITGASGFVGSKLIKELTREKHQVIALTRSIPSNTSQEQNIDWVKWDGKSSLIQTLEGKKIEAIVNLMGENISSKRWSKSQKEKIYNSRIEGTKAVTDYILNFPRNTIKVLVSASAIGIYPVNTNKVFTESFTLQKNVTETEKEDQGFLAGVCQDWEKEANKASIATRVVTPRIGVILGKGGGVLQKLSPIFKTGMGGPIGLGKVPMNWIHIDDLVRFIVFALTEDSYNGPYNLVAPKHVQNIDFTKALAKSLQRPAVFPVPPLILKLAFGELSGLFLDEQQIVPKKLSESGFRWKYTDIHTALKSLI